jgi:hypothetical protein
MTNDNRMPKDKAELLLHIQREWPALLQAIEGLDETQMTRPDAGGWSIKDNLAHITEWERFVLRNQFQGQPAHLALQVDVAVLKPFDETKMNALLFERNRYRTITDVLADLSHTHTQLMAVLKKTTYRQLQKPTLCIGSNMNPLMVWVVYNTYEHYAEHRKTIQEITNRK